MRKKENFNIVSAINIKIKNKEKRSSSKKEAKKYSFVAEKKIVIIFIVVIFLLPIIFNFVLPIKSFLPVIGNEENWLSFWATYIGAIVSALMVYVAIKTVQKTIALNKTTWRINWLDTYRNTAAELLLATNHMTIKQISQDILAKEYKKAANSGRGVNLAFKKSTFIMKCLFNEFDVKYECSKGKKYWHKILPYLKSFKENGGKVIKFALFCESMEDKRWDVNSSECKAYFAKIENDSGEDSYRTILQSVKDLKNGYDETIIHNAIVETQRNFTENVKDMEKVLMEIDEECSKLAYDKL